MSVKAAGAAANTEGYTSCAVFVKVERRIGTLDEHLTIAKTSRSTVK